MFCLFILFLIFLFCVFIKALVEYTIEQTAIYIVQNYDINKKDIK